MRKAEWAYIKTSIKDIISNRPSLNIELKEVDAEYAERFAEVSKEPWYSWERDWVKKCHREAVDGRINNYDPEASFYFIYKDGSCVAFTSRELLTGEIKKPSFHNVVFASYMDTCDWCDTETGNLDFDVTEDEGLEARDAYEDGIEIKYGTQYGRRLQEKMTKTA